MLLLVWWNSAGGQVSRVCHEPPTTFEFIVCVRGHARATASGFQFFCLVRCVCLTLFLSTSIAATLQRYTDELESTGIGTSAGNGMDM